MALLHEAFGMCAVYILAGQLMKWVWFSSPVARKTAVECLTRVVMTLTLPATFLRTACSLGAITLEGWVLVLCATAHLLLTQLLSALLFRRSDTSVRSTLLTSTQGWNIGVFFYPIASVVFGAPGMAAAALLDLPNALFTFVSYPLLNAWAWHAHQRRDPVLLESPVAEDPAGSTPPSQKTSSWKARLVASYARLPLAVRAVLRIVRSFPILAYWLGLVLGQGFGVHEVPGFLGSVLNAAARSNTMCAMVLVGMLLDVRPGVLKANARHAVYVLGLRYCEASVLAVATYLAFEGILGQVFRVMLTIVWFMPVPIVCATFAAEQGFDPSLAAILVNVSMIISFVILWIGLSFLPIPPPHSLSVSRE